MEQTDLLSRGTDLFIFPAIPEAEAGGFCAFH